MKKIALVLLGALLCLSLCGCSLAGFDSKSLMSPPKANADQQAIHKLLQGSRQDMDFIYPQSGEYRYPIIVRDMDLPAGEGSRPSGSTSFALGLYSLEDGGVEVQFLIKSQGEWRTLGSFKNTAIQVDRVCFADLTGSGREDVLIGWGSAAGATGRTAAVNAYHLEDGTVTEHPLGTYGEMTVTDLDGDGVSEVFTVDKFVPAEAEGEEASPAKAKVYAWRDGTMAEICSADADNNVSNYSAALFGGLTDELSGVVLDGAKADGSMTTQVFCLEDGRLCNYPAGVNTENYQNPTSRPTASFSCRDIDGDGLLELPIVKLLPGVAGAADSTGFLVEWHAFLPEGGTRLKLRALMNLSEGYWFRLPYELRDRITAVSDPDRRSVTYTSVMEPDEDGEQLLGFPLFSIRAFTQSAWKSRGQIGGYELLGSQGDTVYGIQIHTQDQHQRGYIMRIKRDFNILSD